MCFPPNPVKETAEPGSRFREQKYPFDALDKLVYNGDPILRHGYSPVRRGYSG
jgi:hypothetical protein